MAGLKRPLLKQAVRPAKRIAQRAAESVFEPPALSVEPALAVLPAAENLAEYSIATTEVVPGLRSVAPKIQRKESDDGSPTPAPMSAPPDGSASSAEQVTAGGTGTTNILAPTVGSKTYSGKTLQDVSNAMPPEPGSLTFDIGAATDGDPITKATVTVKQTMVLARWAERDKQCKPIQAAWDRFASALRVHEDEHVKINRQQLAKAHDRYVGRAKDETQEVTTELENETFAAGQTFDTNTDHGKTATPSTTIEVGVKCDDKNTSTTWGTEEEPVQMKLEVSEPGDPDEEEANRVAEQVMRMAEPGESPAIGVFGGAKVVKRCAACAAEEEKWKATAPAEGGVRVRRKCAECEAEEKKERGEGEGGQGEEKKERVRRKESNSRPVVDESSRVTAVARSGGQPLDADTRAFMEPRFGFDFSQVKIHADSHAAAAARSVNAKAYTLGSNVVFASGQYSPSTSTGRQLLAHELTHVVQQGEHRSAPPSDVIQRAPDPAGTTSTDKSMASSVDTIASDLQFDLKNKPGRREQILRNMLRAEKKSEELKRLYKEKSPGKDADLIADLKPTAASVGWSSADFIRAQRYLDYGELRTVDKIFIAAKGAGTDWPTIERMLPEVNKNFTTVEAGFALDYKDDYPSKSKLPNAQESGIGGLIDAEFADGKDAPEAIKGKAIVAFGEPQPLDLIRAATNGDTLLKPLQQARQDFDTTAILQKRYQERYPESLLQKHIESQVSGDDVKRARMILEGTYSARSRIKLAMGMGIDPDEKEIWAALQEATPAELGELRSEYKNKGDIYAMFKGGTFTGLSKENLLRAEAMLGAGPDGEDPILTKLKAQGGVSGSEIVRVVKTSTKSDWTGYHDAYHDGNGPLRKFADELLNPEEKGQISSYIQDKPFDRIKYGLDHQDVEYVTLQVTVFASDADKKSILENTSLMSAISSNFNARDANKLRDLLIPPNLSPEEKAKLLGDKITRESSSLLSGTANAEALEDEQRELQIALEKAKTDGKLTPEEQQKIADLTKKTEGALAAYMGVRDELNGYLESALSLAASIAVTAATGGASAGMLAAAVARAAFAQAVASVAVKKIVHGDNFNVLSPEATGVFISGFVDGAMNAVGGPAAKTAISAALRDSAKAAALETGNVVFVSQGRTILTRAAEGTISSAPGAMVTTAVDDGTWKQGFAKGFGTVIQSGVEAGIVGAATNVGMGALEDVKILKGDAAKGTSLSISGIPDALGGETHTIRWTILGPVRCSDRCMNLVDSLIERAKRVMSIPADVDVNWFATQKELEPRMAALRERADSINKRGSALAQVPDSVQEELLLREAHLIEMEMCSIEYKVYGVSSTRLPAAKKGKWGVNGDGVAGQGPWYPDDKHAAYAFTKGQPINYENGFPNLTPWADTHISITMKGNAEDFIEADRLGAELAFKRDPAQFGTNGAPDPAKFTAYRRDTGFTWHHKENGTTMQLVPTALHASIPHLGGSSLSRGVEVPPK
ncbi:MAG TPA: DUF4157 domain-containing protein [Vicinamibacterales bacterium]|nr:DUF4157 domain-containing protein [Vicinamibacterales bacterium]